MFIYIQTKYFQANCRMGGCVAFEIVISLINHGPCGDQMVSGSRWSGQKQMGMLVKFTEPKSVQDGVQVN